MLDILRRTVGAGPHFFRLISDNLRSITKEDAVYTPYKGEEETLTRKIKDTEVLIPKNVEIIPVNGFEVYKATLDTFVNEKMARLVPVFDGNTVCALYDDIINHAD